MKILMLGWELPPHNSGGLGVACFHLTKALSKQGVDIEFVVPYKAKHGIEFMEVLSATDIGPLHRFGMGAYDSNFAAEVYSKSKSKDTDAMNIRDVQRRYSEFVDQYLSRKGAPDIVHAHDWLTYEAGVLAQKGHGVPLIAHVHATEFDRSGSDGGNPLVHEIEREGLISADRILSVSGTTKQIIHEKYGIPLGKIDVVYNGFALPDFNEKSADEKYTFAGSHYAYIKHLKESGHRIVTTVARLTVQKGLTLLLRAAAKAIKKNPKLVFVIAGDGEQKNELIELAANLGIGSNVIFTGFVRGQQLGDIYTVSDVFVMSSVSEPFGLTALEAANQGNALVITKQSGVGEVLHNLFRYDFWDTDRLADIIVGISDSPGLLQTLQNGAKAEYAKMPWEVVAKKVANAYNRVMKKGKRR